MKHFRNVSALVFLLAITFTPPAKAQSPGCGDWYFQGGCGCSGWITINFPGQSQGWCVNSDMAGCAADACDYFCSQPVGYMDPFCGSNQWSSWYGFKCASGPCDQ